MPVIGIYQSVNMKQRYRLITSLFISVIIFIVYDTITNEAGSHTSGAPIMRTGSPGDGGATCKNCHAGPTPVTEPGLITSDIPAYGYTAGQTYTITATVVRNGHTKFGFEISPQSSSGTLLGTMIVTNTTETQLIGSGKYITHKTGGVSGTNSRTWVFNWTAPAAGTGNVTFYGAFNITNAMNNSSGDTTVLSTLTVSECAVPAQPGAISGPAVICHGGGIFTYSIAPVPGASDYLWSIPGDWYILNDSSNSIQVLSGASLGNISVAAVNNCGAGPPVSLSLSFDQLAVSISSTDVSCNGDGNGSATAIPSSGLPPYVYSWAPVGGTDSTLANLAAGNYYVTVTDNLGCMQMDSVIIHEPAAIALNTSVSNANCGNANGSATVTVNGGTPAYTYSWNTVPVQNTATASNLSAGMYTVTVTDENLCFSSANVSIINMANPAVNVVNVADVTCFNGTDGEATVQVSGGTSPYTFQWNPSGGSDSTAHNLHAGAYSVTITDATGCSATTNVVINEPSAIALSFSTTDAACSQSNGSAAVTVTGGAGGYTYQWNTLPVQTTDSAVNLAAGSYNVYVTDSNGCLATATVVVNNTSGPTLVPGTVTDVSCFNGNDGELSIIVSSGTGPFTYQWMPSGGNDTLARNLHAGAYAVEVTDSLGCISLWTGTVSEPPLLIVHAGPDQSTCAGSPVILGSSPAAEGGTPAYSYLWSPDADLSSATDSMPVATPAASTNYLVIVTDAHGCQDSSALTLTVNPVPAIPGITFTNDTLFSTTALNYQWYLYGNVLTGATMQYYVPSQPGNYTVVVTDSIGCASTSDGFFYNSVTELFGSASVPLIVYPNPAGETIMVSGNIQLEPGAAVYVYTLTGDKVLSSTIQQRYALPQTGSVDVGKLPAANYFLEIISGEQIYFGKFVKN